MPLPAFLLLKDTAENRTLCRARALSKREAFVASGRGRRQAAEAGAGSRSGHADSPRKLSAQYRCDVDPAPNPGLSPSTNPPHRGESNSMQGASVKQTRSVCSERARTPAGGRSRCGFAKRTRGFSAQTVNKIWMRCRSGVYSGSQSINGGPNRGESNSVQGAGVKKTRKRF